MSFFLSAIKYCDIGAWNVISCENGWVPTRNTSSLSQPTNQCLNQFQTFQQLIYIELRCCCNNLVWGFTGFSFQSCSQPLHINFFGEKRAHSFGKYVKGNTRKIKQKICMYFHSIPMVLLFKLLSMFLEYYLGLVFGFNTDRLDFRKLCCQVQLWKQRWIKILKSLKTWIKVTTKWKLNKKCFKMIILKWYNMNVLKCLKIKSTLYRLVI